METVLKIVFPAMVHYIFILYKIFVLQNALLDTMEKITNVNR
jgi:hypothetical protein